MPRLMIRAATGLAALVWVWLATIPVVSVHAATAAIDEQRRAASLASPSIVLVEITVKGYLKDSRDGKTYGPFGYSATGTGFFISDNGYVLTSAHVGSPSDDDIKARLAEQYLVQDATLNTTCVADGTCTALEDSHRAGYIQATTMTQLTRGVQVLTQNQKAVSVDTIGLTAEVKASSPTLGRDAAILHVNAKNTPAVQLANSDHVKTLDPVTVVGYPVDTLGSSRDKTALVPTVTTGRITANGHGDSGIGIAPNVDVFHTEVPSAPGDSGGPAIDNTGKVVGLVSYGTSAKPTTGTLLITANDIATVVKQSGADITPGRIDSLWRAGFGLMDKHYYASAKKDFDACAALSAIQVGCVAESARAGGLLSSDREPADIAAATSGRATFPGGLVAGVVVLILLAGGVVVIAVVRRNAVAGAGAPHPQPGAQFGAPWPPVEPAPPPPPLSPSPAAPSRLCKACGFPLGNAPFCGACGAHAG